MNKIDKLLKKNLYKDPTLDTQLSTACLQYITERIEFQPAIQPDSYLDQLKYKYRPLNLPNTTKVMEVETSTASSGGNESTVLPSDSIPKPRQVLYNSDNLQMKWVGSRGVGSGLSNMGNTCFLNSVLQCLTYTPPLYNYIHCDDHKTSCQFQGFCTMCELHRHITRVMNTSGGVVKPIPIVQNLKVFAKHFRYGRQEDAHEFLRYFIDALQRVCLHGYPPKMDQYSKYTTVIHQIFGGYHRSQVKCLECHRTSNTYDPLLDVSLDIKGCSSLIQALQRSIKPDLLDKENKYACPFCKTLTQAQKKFTIHCLPNVLTLQLKRFDYNSVFGGKVNKMINYDEYLDLRPYMSEPQGPQEWYRLYAVLVHFGFSCHSGHYFCYVRNSNGIWYSLNDSAVSQVSLSTVLAQEAYLLFYIKDTDYNPPPPSQKKSTLSTNYNKVQSDLGVSVKQTSNVDKTGKPLVHTKPMGVVTPSPKVIPPPPPPPPPSHPPPGPFSHPPPPPSHPPPPPPPPPPMKNTTSQFSTDDSFELRKSATPTVKPHATIPAKQPPPPPSVKTTPSVLARPGFTPRSVLKSTKQSLSRPHTPPIKERTLLEIAEESEQNVSLLNNKPKAYVTPITKKPVARVPPSPQMLGKEVSPHKMEESRMTELAQTDSSDHWNVSNVSATTYGPSLPPQYVQASSPTWSVTALKNNMLPEERNDKIKVVFNKSTKKSHHLHHDDDSEDLDSDEEDVIEKPKDESSKERKQHHRKHHHSSNSVSDEVRGSKKKRHRNVSSSEDEEERIRKTSDHKRSDIKHKKYKDYRHHSPHKYENSDSDIEVPKRSRPERPRSRTPERSRKRHHNSSEGRYHRERRSSSLSDERKSHSLKRKKHTHSEPRKRTKSETHSAGDSKKVTKDIKVLKWDEPHHHRHHHHHHTHRHHSETSSSVLDLLDKPNQLGSEVRTWEGERNTIDSSKKEGESKRRGRDEWDREIDKGKVKKTKKHSDIDWERKNKFQDYQNKINAQKHSK